MSNQQKEPRVNISLTGQAAVMMEQIKAAMEKQLEIKLSWPQVIEKLINNHKN